MEHGRRYAAAHAQGVVQIQGGLGMGADHQQLAVPEHLEGVDEPVDAGVLLPPGGFLGLELILQSDFRIERSAALDILILRRAGQRVGVELTFREAADHGPGVAVQHPAGAVPVEQLANDGAAGFFGNRLVVIGQAGRQCLRAIAQPGGQGCPVSIGQLAGIEQPLDGFGHRLIAAGFLAECLQVVEAVRIQQAQAGEVTGLAELLRSCGQQQHGGDAGRQLLDQRVFRAGALLMPHQVVGLIDDQHVPVAGLQPVRCLCVLQQELQ